MVAMSSDSYLLKTPQPVCQGCQMNQTRSTACGVLLTLVLLVAAVLSLAVLGYYLAVELRAVRAELQHLQGRLHSVDDQVTRLNIVEQMKAWENPWRPQEELPDSDEVEDEEDVSDGLDPIYPDDEHFDVVENRAKDTDTARVVAPLQPAGGSPQPVDSVTEAFAQQEDVVGVAVRRRREAASGQASLRLYHTLQTPGPAPAPAAAPPVEGAGYRAAMYAEHAPLGYVTPPARPHAHALGTTTAPITSRSSRVMDGAHKRRHKKVGQQQQQQLQQRLQVQHEVAQDVSQAVSQDEAGPERSVEVGRRQPMRAQLQPQRDWRGPWRGVRVTDTFRPSVPGDLYYH